MKFHIVAVGLRWNVVAERRYVAGTPNRPSIHFTLANGTAKCRFHWVIGTDDWIDDMNSHLPVQTVIACRNNLVQYFANNKAGFAALSKL